MFAIRLVLDRICSPRKSRTFAFNLPSTGDASGIANAQQEILRAVCAGEIVIDEARALSGLVEARRRALEIVELEARVSYLESDVRP